MTVCWRWGAVQDTYTLIRKGIRRVLKAAGYQTTAKQRGLATKLAAYCKAENDWNDQAARAAQLKVLAADARAALEVALAERPDAEVRAAGWLLTKILGDRHGQRTGAGLTVVQVMGDTRIDTAHYRAACEIELLSPLPEATDPAVAKAAFTQDLEAPSATCPAGHTTTTVRTERDPQSRPVLQSNFPRAVWQACELFARCVRGQMEGRTFTSHYHEGLLQTARAQQATPEFEKAYRKRAAVERKMADLVGHGLRRARYLGRAKVRLQNYWIGAGVNLKRLFRLFQADTGQMRLVLAALAAS